MATTEYDIFLPQTDGNGKAVPPAVMQSIKDTLSRAFGGSIETVQGEPGEWSYAGITFHDQVTLLRVVDDGSTSFDMWGYKRRLATQLNQDEVLIISRQIRIL